LHAFGRAHAVPKKVGAKSEQQDSGEEGGKEKGHNDSSIYPVSAKYAENVYLVENDFWGRKKRILDSSDHKSGFIDVSFCGKA
jgi:hypothetical protein